MAEAQFRTLSKRVLDRLSVNGKDAIFRDRDLAGFGIRVYPSGKKVFVVQTRAFGRSKRVRLGRYPALTPEAARKDATAVIARIKKSQSPVPPEPAPDPTVADLAERYQREYVEMHCKPATVFENTPYGISVWVCVLFERFVCCRPLHRVAAWLADMGLAISPGTLGDSVKRFVPLFEPVADAVLAHQNTAALRHADETTWRVQALREKGRSSRAWLWTSVSDDAVYFHIDPSRSTEVAKTLFGAAACVLLLVCDRLSTYKSLARELGGKVVLCWCWAHQRRSFLDCAAGHVRLTRWCQGWIERIAAIYRLNDARLEHYDPTLERQRPEFDARQRELQAAVARLFADAEAELAGLSDKARRARALRSLVNHREGLSVFVDRAQVPMDNNKAELALRSAVIARHLSFGSDSERGARFTAMMYSVAGTLSMNGIDVRRWLGEWLTACANNGARAPHDLSPWLPWSMNTGRRRALAAPG